jgi:hypothetical protein
MTNKMQLCRTIYYSIAPWLVNMFRAIISLETCWAVKEQRNNKLPCTVAICWSFLEDLCYDARIHERQEVPMCTDDTFLYTHTQFNNDIRVCLILSFVQKWYIYQELNIFD